MAELGLRDKRGGRPRGGSGRPGVAGLPLVSARFAVGRLSSSELRAITRVATPEKEETLVADADHATAAQLEAVVRGFRQTRRSLDDLEPDGAEALAHRERRGVR